MEIMDRQFERPRGILGKLAGIIMNLENRKINKWTIQHLKPKTGDIILEIGYGPGYAIKKLVDSKKGVVLHGIDLSANMEKMAAKKNSEAVEKGNVQLYSGDISEFTGSCQYDKVYTVNNYPLWEKKENSLQRIHHLLKDGGKIVITVQPREDDADAAKTRKLGKIIHKDLERAGFHSIDIHFKKVRPVLTVCVTAYK